MPILSSDMAYKEQPAAPVVYALVECEFAGWDQKSALVVKSAHLFVGADSPDPAAAGVCWQKLKPGKNIVRISNKKYVPGKGVIDK